MFNKINTFFKEVKIEFKKSVFPTRGEVIDSTKIVIITVLIISVFLGFVDICLTKLMSFVLR